MEYHFLKALGKLPFQKPLKLSDCRSLLTELFRDMESVIAGQQAMIWRAVQALLLNKHMLVEGLPGEAKTKCVQTLALCSGLKFSRIQFVPDMVPSDLLGIRVLALDAKGRPTLEPREGPLCAPLVVADEINRAPSKVQAAMLQVMQERQISRIDLDQTNTPYSESDRYDLKRVREEHHNCFGASLPDHTDPHQVHQVVVATQNPIEVEGTYPLSEAQTDRFAFKVIVEHPSLVFYESIARINLFGQGTVPWDGKPEGVPSWLRAICLFRRIRSNLFDEKQGMVEHLFQASPGLWHRVCLLIMLSHYQNAQHDMVLMDDDELPTAMRNPVQEALRWFVAEWNQSGAWRGDGESWRKSEKLRRNVDVMLTGRFFEYTERGSSPRGLIDWLSAAAAEAFLRGDNELQRSHFRNTAEDVLRHRIGIQPQAEADQVKTSHVIQQLVQNLLADGDGLDDASPVVPKELLDQLYGRVLPGSKILSSVAHNPCKD